MAIMPRLADLVASLCRGLTRTERFIVFNHCGGVAVEGSINKGQTCTDRSLFTNIRRASNVYIRPFWRAHCLGVWVGVTRQERSGKCALSELRRFTESLTWWPGWPRGATTCRFQRGPEYILVIILYTFHLWAMLGVAA